MSQIQPASYAACPNCGSTDAKKVSFTWWGGALGPALFKHVQCSNCKTQYNGKTGKSNMNNIIIYFVATFVIALCACGGIAILGTLMNN